MYIMCIINFASFNLAVGKARICEGMQQVNTFELCDGSDDIET